MALFKILKGNEANLPSTMTDGWAYFCTDTSNFFIDYEDDGGVLHRAQLNAKDAETILGLSPASVINNNELEIPRSSAVFQALSEKSDVGHTHDWEELENRPFGFNYERSLDLSFLEMGKTDSQLELPENVTIARYDPNYYDMTISGISMEDFNTLEYLSGSEIAYVSFSDDCWDENGNFSAKYENFAITQEAGTDTVMMQVGCYTEGRISHCPNLLAWREYTPIDEIYIPDTIARKSDIENIDLSPYETKTDATSKLNEANAYTDSSLATFEFITVADIDAICNGVTEGALDASAIDELMAELNPEEAI